MRITVVVYGARGEAGEGLAGSAAEQPVVIDLRLRGRASRGGRDVVREAGATETRGNILRTAADGDQRRAGLRTRAERRLDTGRERNNELPLGSRSRDRGIRAEIDAEKPVGVGREGIRILHLAGASADRGPGGSGNQLHDNRRIGVRQAVRVRDGGGHLRGGALRIDAHQQIEGASIDKVIQEHEEKRQKNETPVREFQFFPLASFFMCSAISRWISASWRCGRIFSTSE